jgi:hypothetical protein
VKNITTCVGVDAHPKDRFVAMLIEDQLTSRPPVEIPIASFRMPAGNAKKHRQGETGEPWAAAASSSSPFTKRCD